MAKRATLAELAYQAGGEPLRYRGRYLLVRWDIDTTSLESRHTLEQAIDLIEADEQLRERGANPK